MTRSGIQRIGHSYSVPAGLRDVLTIHAIGRSAATLRTTSKTFSATAAAAALSRAERRRIVAAPAGAAALLWAAFIAPPPSSRSSPQVALVVHPAVREPELDKREGEDDDEEHPRHRRGVP